ncbi:MAG TPA: biosynthetic peptidoglycan transglycosylase [Minicystis sp.]|nr:biosynthetic peptidoglycan transglycosylase [Minicystis sp.]
MSVLGGRSVRLRGGAVTLVGSREEIAREIETWRAKVRGAGSASPAAPVPGTHVDLSGVDVAWQDMSDHPAETLSAKQVQIERAGDGLRLEAASASLGVRAASVEVTHPRVLLARRDGAYRLHELAAERVEAALVLADAAAPARDEVPPGDAVGNEPTAARADGGEGRAARLRDKLVRVAQGVDAALEPGARVHLSGVHARVHRGDDVLNLGPGSFDVRREASRLEIELAPELAADAAPPAGQGAPASEQAVTFHLSVPLGSAPEPVVADVRGGPVGLAALGVREGDFGLFDVAKTSLVTRSHVVLSPDGHSLSIDGEGKIQALSIRNAALSDEPVAGLDVAWRGKGDLDLDGRRVRVDDAEVDLGALRLLAHGTYERVGDARRVHATYEMPLTACQAMLDSAPAGLVAKLRGMRFAGSFGIKGTVRFDTANLDRTYKVDWDVTNSCRVTDAPPDIAVERFSHAFRRTVYTPDGNPTQIESGPETPDWVPLSRISKFMAVAVQTTEDGAFQRHHGFDQEAIKNSIRENLRKMKFVRGASTISMQLAKNVYLDRTKNLARKLQEAVLTMYLEQELTKEQILELYLNVVEFGPMVYGIGPAARSYFNTTAADLSLGQALYISSIMPNPKVQHFGAGGAVSPSWASYLRKLMRIAYERHRISEDELDEGLRETVVRGSPAPDRAPRGEGRPGEGAPDEEPPGGDPAWIAP